LKNKKLAEQLKKEFIYLAVAFIAIIIIFKIGFYKENFITIARTAAGIFWIFVLPGFYLMYYWYEKLSFIERFIIGVVTSTAVIGISSYYFGLIGINIKYHTILLPLIFLAADFVIILNKTRKE